MAESVKVFLTVTATPAAPRVPLEIPKDATPTELLCLVSEKTFIPLDKVRLISQGKFIVADETKVVEEYKLVDELVLHVMGKPAPPPPAAAAPPTPLGTVAPNPRLRRAGFRDA